MKTTTKQKLAIALAAVATLGVTGCQPEHTDYSAFVRVPRPTVTATEYRMAPPDSIAISSKRVREINGLNQTIRPDGMITVPLLGEVYAAGKTPLELGAELEQLAQQYYEDADASVRVTSFASKKIFVFGEVAVAGPYAYDGANTIFETLARAQPSRLSNPSKIQVLRPNADGTLRRAMTIDFNKMVQEGDTTLDAVLEENDVIYVPPNTLASIGLSLQQLLLPLTPAASVVNGPANIESAAGRYGGDSTNSSN
ncbi:polysaccharide biosynthesis/export family protein [Mucisphaera sp.]|uniref:polysaccharide biosynthesis/export family protein n=1 Tax=Mucisphaera sp. TaxID=2913024 RepID=UPI003D0D30C3